jgi:hypothetical protein
MVVLLLFVLTGERERPSGHCSRSTMLATNATTGANRQLKVWIGIGDVFQMTLPDQCMRIGAIGSNLQVLIGPVFQALPHTRKIGGMLDVVTPGTGKGA